MFALPLILAQTVALVEFSAASWESTPEMIVQDAYKWLFHATMGGEHAIKNEARVRDWMDREWDGLNLQFNPNEPEFTPLDPFGVTARWNLRPAKRRGLNKEVILTAFLTSAGQFKPQRENFVLAWEMLGRKIQNGQLPQWTHAQWLEFDVSTRASGYPAVHHSEPYERLYAPAYRVIVRTAYPLAAPGGE